MQKKEFVSKIAEKAGMKKTVVEAVIDGFISVVGEAFDNEERVELRGFGNFIRKDKKARKARNVNTGEIVDVPAKSVLTFNQSKLFRK